MILIRIGKTTIAILSIRIGKTFLYFVLTLNLQSQKDVQAEKEKVEKTSTNLKNETEKYQKLDQKYSNLETEYKEKVHAGNCLSKTSRHHYVLTKLNLYIMKQTLY